MHPTSSATNNRILIIDDNPAIHADFAKVLKSGTVREPSLEDAESVLFGRAISPPSSSQFHLEFAFQGEEGLKKVETALAAGGPFAIAFVDVRMPPGWDGIETITRLWKVDARLQVVLCTAYSDYSWNDISQRVGSPENLLILKKPFDNIEVVQLAHALTNKWKVTSQANALVEHLDSMVTARTQELREANSRLALSVQEAERLAEAAEAANKAKGEFLTVVSHEMLTPMNGILGLAGYLDGTPLTPDQQECTRDILSSSERLMNIIQQVLDFVDADAPQAAADSVDLRAVIDRVIEAQAGRLAAKTLRLSIESSCQDRPLARGCAKRIQRILASLIDNAIRYSSQGNVTIEISRGAPAQSGGKFLRCAISDQGIGIPAAKHGLIFRPFTQVDTSLTRDHEGLGLSLALARKLVEAMEGQIGFTSETGRGSTFWITLPETEAAINAIPRAAA